MHIQETLDNSDNKKCMISRNWTPGKMRISALISFGMILVFCSFGVFELYAAYKSIFASFCRNYLLILIICIAAIGILCTWLLTVIPSRWYRYSIAVIFEIFLVLYVLVFFAGVPDRFIESWAAVQGMNPEPEETYAYQLGEMLTFGSGGTAQKYAVTGFSFDEDSSWTTEYYAKMCFLLDQRYEDLVLEFGYDVYAAPQQVLIYVNGNELCNFTVSESGNQTLDIPAEYTQDNGLKLEFAFPNAVSPASRGENGDVRPLALNMHDICIHSKSESEKQFEYQIGELISFTESDIAEKYCLNGFSIEPGNVWTSEKSAEMHFKLTDEYENLVLNFQYGVYAPPQNVEVYANDNLLGSFTAVGDGEQEFDIPGDFINEGKLNLRFALPDAVSPASRGESGDVRLLALNMKNIQIAAQEGEEHGE